MHHILLVDDELALSELTKEYLEAKDFRVTLCHQPFAAVELMRANPVQLCVLDVKMPDKDGFTLANEIRQAFPEIPIIFLTGQTLKEDRIKGFLLGADDYISKPYSMEELNLRILAILKRYQISQSAEAGKTTYQLGVLVYKPESREIFHGEKSTRLTAIENKLLTLLCDHMNKTLNRDIALRTIWGDNDIYKGRSMNVYITKLRNLLKAEPRLEILNAHGEGYCLSFREVEN